MRAKNSKIWEEQISSEGKIYWYNKKEGTSQWKDPFEDQLSEAQCWKIVKDVQGRPFFYNSRTKAVQWKRPAEYTKEIEKAQEIKFSREKFFKMLSSSVPTDLNPFKYHTPDIFTIREMSARFDRDPRLINTWHKNPNYVERFLDEWLILERRRRVELERRLVSNAMEKLREKMLQRAESGEITETTTWDEAIQMFKLNPDWRILLNYDRLQVFTAIIQQISQEAIIRYANDREIVIKEETRRRVRFYNALKTLLEGEDLVFAAYTDYEERIIQLPEYAEI